MMLNAVFPIAAEIVKAEAILVRIIFVQQSKLQARPSFGINDTFENRMLNSLPVTQAGFCHSPQSSAALGCGCRNIVADEDKHAIIFTPPSQQQLDAFSAPNKWRIRIQIASKESRQ